jgi:excisionase family DNA binding protein
MKVKQNLDLDIDKDPIDTIDCKTAKVHLGSNSQNDLFFENSVGEKTQLIKVLEAARFLGLTERALRLMVYREEVPFFRIGKRIRFSKDILERWITGQFVAPRNDRFPPNNRR